MLYANICQVLCLSLKVHATLVWGGTSTPIDRQRPTQGLFSSYRPAALWGSGSSSNLSKSPRPPARVLYSRGSACVINVWLGTTAETKTALGVPTVCLRHKRGFLIVGLFVTNTFFSFRSSSYDSQTLLSIKNFLRALFFPPLLCVSTCVHLAEGNAWSLHQLHPLITCLAVLCCEGPRRCASSFN